MILAIQSRAERLLDYQIHGTFNWLSQVQREVLAVPTENPRDYKQEVKEAISNGFKRCVQRTPFYGLTVHDSTASTHALEQAEANLLSVIIDYHGEYLRTSFIEVISELVAIAAVARSQNEFEQPSQADIAAYVEASINIANDFSEP
ncbi:hypothetical protein [Streptomyces sp. NPDC005476]|uniref:hypothetical protein n=1 Tax=Streptomyces sp. NPDC005476 TaxID=3156882 RepID=UPI00345168E4